MSIGVLVYGATGTGKSTSIRNLDMEKTLVIKSVPKPMPFRVKEEHKNHFYLQRNADKIIEAMRKTKAEIIVIDDFQYLLSQPYMETTGGNQFDLFKQIGKIGYDIAMEASRLPENKRVYILGHSQTDEAGNTKIKTLGKLLDEKIVLEGLFTICLKTVVNNGEYKFATRNSGFDTVKTPMGLFEESEIDNDLAVVDSAICDYYSITSQKDNK